MRRRWICGLVAGLMLIFAWRASAEDAISVGIAIADITPPVPYRMSGYFRERLSTGTHDPLRAKAVVFEQGGTRAALVFCDLAGIAPGVSAKARLRAGKQTGIPRSNILIAATHSHTGPLYFGALRKFFHDRRIQEHGQDDYEAVDYPAQLVETLVGVIRQADSNRKPMRIRAGLAREDRLSFNRRFFMKDGSVRFNPGKGNPAILRPAGPIDPDVGLLSFHPMGQEPPSAVMTVFALHLDTVGGTMYSADYPIYLERTLRGHFGKDLISLFATGPCGDINHVDVSHKKPQKGQEDAERIGTTLAATVADQLAKLRPLARPGLVVQSEIVRCPLQQYTPEEFSQSAVLMKQVASSKVPFLERVKAYKIQALQLRKGSTLPMEVQVFRLGDNVAIVGLPGEIFVELSLAIKRASPFQTTIVVELCNDAPGYIPTTKAFAEGSYETVNSRIQPGSGERLVETALRLPRKLKQAEEPG